MHERYELSKGRDKRILGCQVEYEALTLRTYVTQSNNISVSK